MNTYYKTQSLMSDPGKKSYLIKEPLADISTIVQLTQNVLIHQLCIPFYGLQKDESRFKETWIRPIEEKLDLWEKRGNDDMHTIPSLDKKIYGICRDFALLSTSLCRQAGIAARARCGFATYFEKDIYMDHWVLEYWHVDEERWILVDSQMDTILIKGFHLDFDTKDISHEKFVNGAEAWQLCRSGKKDASRFGIFEWWGYDYLACNLILDANSLLKNPMQPWDSWPGLKSVPNQKWSAEDYQLLDELAQKILDVDKKFEAFEEFVNSNDKIKVPADQSMITNTLEDQK